MLIGSKQLKVKVAFKDIGINGWTGGLNYFRNLFKALKICNSFIEPVVFIKKGQKDKFEKIFEENAELIESPIYEEKSILNRINRKLYKITNENKAIDWYYRKNQIKVFSHLNNIVTDTTLKKTCWIPDFQHIKLPKVFSKDDIQLRNHHFNTLMKKSDLIFLSSNSAFNDLKTFANEYSNKVRIIKFVSIPDAIIYKKSEKTEQQIEEKFQIKPGDKFFYLPNQFWKHKNHKVVFEAVNILKHKGINIKVLCSGLMEDYRGNSHIEELKKYIKINNLNENIKLLGLIELNEVHYFMRNCISIINPSLFEGWSTTVEEAKSIGKNIILSNINVHIEQNPPESKYFDPHEPNELANILFENHNKYSFGPDYKLEENAIKILNQRIQEYVNTYEKYIIELIN